MATTINTDYLRFDAFSIKDLIKQKLSEDPTFTDFIYEGSNLSILIDIFANTFQSLSYNLNHAASESMFADTQIYENMNRLVKLIGYNPRGYTTSTALVSLSGVSSSNNGKILLPYTHLNTGKTDDSGKPIYYSTIDYWYVYDDDTIVGDDDSNNILMYNGIWKFYNRINIADGIPYETFVLDGVSSDAEAESYVSFPHIHVYVKRFSYSGTYSWIQYAPAIDGLFIDTEKAGTSIYGPTDAVFELRLNEDKVYEIKFGDGINGAALRQSDELYIFYLDSNGPDGELEANDISNATLKHDPTALGIDSVLYDSIFSSIINSAATLGSIVGTNRSITSTPAEEETVDQIRTSAPQWFKSSNRLVTQRDFEYFIKNRFYNDIIDVKAMNNWQYMATFYRWLYNIGISKYSDGSKYINENIMTKYDYKYADAADSNNIYLWIKMKNDTDIIKDTLDAEIMPLKIATAETVFIDPIPVNLMPCANTVSASAYLSEETFDVNLENYIEVEVDNSTLVSYEVIKTTMNDIIADYFSPDNQQLGSFIDLNFLYNQLMSIRGINRIRTIYDNGTNNSTKIDGLSFAKWSASVIDPSDDLTISNMSFTLESFQFPRLYTTDLSNYIRVIVANVSQTHRTEY